MKRMCIKNFYFVLCLCMILGVITTRGNTIKHNFMGHPDEHVFYGSTELLMYDLLYGEDYEPVKAYPEGTYVFRMPFHLLAQVIDLEEDYTYNVRLWGRIASVFYYSLGCVLGLWLVVNVLDGGKPGAVIYALVVIFSLFQIEISRYGTFDPISFFVLMLALYLLAQYIRKNKRGFFLASVFCIAVATAGKYSLAYFFVLPIVLLLLQKENKKQKFAIFCLMVLFALLGFIIFSPSVIKNPRFFISTIFGGLEGYVVGGNPEGYSTVPESFFSALAYQMFYSDIPLATVFAVFGVLHVCRLREASLERKFFGVVLPLAMFVFLVYNCLLTTFFLRTLFPYYCISSIYAAAGLAQLFQRKKLRIVAVILCGLMIIRSTYFLSIMSDYDVAERRAKELRETIEENGITEVVWLDEFFEGLELEAVFDDYETKIEGIYSLLSGKVPEIQEGQLVLSGSIEHGWAKYCIFPPKKAEIINITQAWEQFKTDNQEYYIGSLFPQHYYWLFGYWVHGSTATNYEFPNSYFYYKPVE